MALPTYVSGKKKKDKKKRFFIKAQPIGLTYLYSTKPSHNINYSLLTNQCKF